MTRNFVITGGAGFLGKWLTKVVLDEYRDSRVKVIDLMDDKSKLPDFMKGDRVDLFFGKDICNSDMSDLMKGSEGVFHLAGYISFWNKEREKSEFINVGGTRRTLESALKAEVPKLVHVSSVAALGYDGREHVLVDENFKFNWDIAEAREKWYMLTKHQADLVVEEFVDKGLDCCIAYPGLMWGPKGEQNSLGFIKSIYNNKMPLNMPGGTNVVDVRDVASGLVDIFEKGEKGEGYLLSGYNLSFKKINSTVAQIVGTKPPKVTLPMELYQLLYSPVYLLEKLAKKRPKLTSDNIHSSRRFRYFSNNKAQRELGWKLQFSFKQTIRDTVKWAKEEGHL